MIVRLRKLVGGVCLLVVFLSFLAPLNVLYHMVRSATDHRQGTDAALISEFESFRNRQPGKHIGLVEPAALPTTERIRRLYLAQFALAPVLVTRTPQSVQLVNLEVRKMPPARTTLGSSRNYVLIEQ